MLIIRGGINSKKRELCPTALALSAFYYNKNKHADTYIMYLHAYSTSAFAPVYNSAGDIVGIVGVDCSATEIRLQQSALIRKFMLIELAGLAIAVVLSLVISGVLSRSVSAIAGKMSELA